MAQAYVDSHRLGWKRSRAWSALMACWSLCAFAEVGCTANATAVRDDAGARTMETSDPDLSLQVRGQAMHSDEWLPVGPEDILHNGDRFTLSIHSKRSLFLYVTHRGSDLVDHALFPIASVASRIDTDGTLTLPTDGSALVLGTHSGEETLLVVGAETSLSAAALGSALAAAPICDSSKDRERPPDPSSKTRPLGGAHIPTSQYRAKSILPGVWALRFTFLHQQ